jgi:hypothetical protein
MIANLKVKFEPHMVNWIFKWFPKDPKKKKHYVIFRNFLVKNFIIKEMNKEIKFQFF